jgi:1-acyl-sn-glycerol-3-phosphate acyltransferase
MFERIRWGALNTVQVIYLGVWSVFWMSAAILSVFATGSGKTALRWARTRWAPGLLWASGATIEVIGLDNVDWSKPHVFVTNHQSMIDIPVFFTVIPTNLHFIAKKVLFSVPFLGWYMRVGGMIPVDRSNGPEAIKMLKKSAERVAAGDSVLAFAEGTRSRTGAIIPFKKGAFMLAIQAQVGVVPVTIEGARNVLPSDGFSVRPSSIKVAFGAPIPTVGLGPEAREQVMQQAHDEVVKMNVALGGVGAASVQIESGGKRRRLSRARPA